MKHNCLFRPAILTSMVVASCLFANAYVESNTLRGELTTPVTISENGSLVTKLTPVWERQLSNDDANQNQMSMALANGNIYVCVDYFNGDRNGKIFIRKYDCTTGAETMHVIEYPKFDDMPYQPEIAPVNPNFPFIVSDDTETLFVAQVWRLPDYVMDESHNVVRVYFAEIDQNDMTIIKDNLYFAEAMLTLNGAMWMERIDRVNGSIKDGNFSFRAVFAGKPNSYYSYYIMDYRGVPEMLVAFDAGSDNQTLAYPQLSNIPETDAYILTGMPYNNVVSKELYLYTPDNPEQIKLGWKFGENCRGIIPFVHNGQLYAVYAKTNNSTDGSQFQLIELNASSGMHVDVASFPKVPFSVKNPQYKAVQQMAVARPVTVKNRADAATEATDLYVYAPGAGVGAYRIETKEDTSNGIVPVAAADVQVKWINGQLQFGSSDFDGQSVKIYSATGQLVLTAEICNGVADLNGLSAGFYVAVTPAGTYKICR